ncbi:retrovirus-related Pol polyprotein from transposon 412 [Trichonephila clavipes]|nr:retrovirus-related Pol polyprotein from transposon 412 [Trichonephila clavipes]
MDYFTKWSYFRPRGLDCCKGSSSTLDLMIRGPSTTALLSREKLRFCSLQETVRPPVAPLAPEEYIEKLQARMEEIHPLARERIDMASEKMKTRYDARATGHDFHEGDKEWLRNPKRLKGLSLKL